MPDKYNFDHLPDRGAIELRCIEKDCGFSGTSYSISEEMRHAHFLTHFNEAQTVISESTGVVYEVTGDVRIQPCRTCGNEFSQPRRRGRPRLTCEVCSNP